MRKFLGIAAIAATAAFASPALAQPANYGPDRETGTYAALGTGAVVGTVAGVGLYNGWWGSGATATSLGATAASSAVAGGVIGVGAVALVDAATQPCRGFSAFFNVRPTECVNGEYVGYQPRMRRVR